jgi:hypothetical protein
MAIASWADEVGDYSALPDGVAKLWHGLAVEVHDKGEARNLDHCPEPL